MFGLIKVNISKYQSQVVGGYSQFYCLDKNNELLNQLDILNKHNFEIVRKFGNEHIN